MKKQLLKVASVALLTGLTFSGCDLFDSAKEAAEEALQEVDTEALKEEAAGETDQCKAYWDQYEKTNDKDVFALYKKECLKTGDDSKEVAEQNRPASLGTATGGGTADQTCLDAYDRAYVLADSLYFEYAEDCDYNPAAAATCEAHMEPVKVLINQLLNECGVPQEEIFVRRFSADAFVMDEANCTFPMFVPGDTAEVMVKCQANPVCEQIQGKHQEKWQKADGSGVVTVPCYDGGCPMGSFFDPYAGECVQDNFGYNAVQCGPGQVPGANGECITETVCGQGEWFDGYNGVCVVDEWWCPEGMFKPSPESECQEDNYSKGADNGCGYDQIWDGTACIAMAQCTPEQVYQFSTGLCIDWKNCSQEQWFDIEANECKQNFQDCGPGQFMDFEQGICVTQEACPAGQYFDYYDGKCRYDDKAYNDFVAGQLTGDCGYYYRNMDGDDEQNPAMKSFLTECIEEFISITSVELSANATCNTAYGATMRALGPCMLEETEATCETFMTNIETFKTNLCTDVARALNPDWVFLAEGAGDDDDDDDGEHDGEHQGTEGTFCPEGKFWDDMAGTCWEDQMMTIPYVDDGMGGHDGGTDVTNPDDGMGGHDDDKIDDGTGGEGGTDSGCPAMTHWDGVNCVPDDPNSMCPSNEKFDATLNDCVPL